MRVALVSVGDEILAGDTVNTNATWLSQQLNARGATVERVTVVPDRIADIARVVNEYHAAYDAVIVTGGLGPTHDDLTMEGIGAAFGRAVERNEAALEWLTTATPTTTLRQELPTCPSARGCFRTKSASHRGVS
jgi:molybdenum cofactor synthesis domain-containing protein